ncbi:hypothetical protein AVEN_271534-1 [Araneus ventricosus]|uniref:Uncharacterized protein n=1 Tax=Araneus ventricosus TaxID=182803 RepID=A0A4Y2G1T8_ARAVE|nr:hypothetical protein AVEN_271534-1 [Araneus ventricosus]
MTPKNLCLLFDLVHLDRLVLPGYFPGREQLWSKAVEARRHLSRLSLSSQFDDESTRCQQLLALAVKCSHYRENIKSARFLRNSEPNDPYLPTLAQMEKEYGISLSALEERVSGFGTCPVVYLMRVNLCINVLEVLFIKMKSLNH